MNKLTIPTTFELARCKHAVEVVEFIDGELLGEYSGGKLTIQIANYSKRQLITESKKLNTFYHELVHSILNAIERNDLSNDETLVTNIGNMLMEFDLTRDNLPVKESFMTCKPIIIDHSKTPPTITAIDSDFMASLRSESFDDVKDTVLEPKKKYVALIYADERYASEPIWCTQNDIDALCVKRRIHSIRDISGVDHYCSEEVRAIYLDKHVESNEKFNTPESILTNHKISKREDNDIDFIPLWAVGKFRIDGNEMWFSQESLNAYCEENGVNNVIDINGRTVYATGKNVDSLEHNASEEVSIKLGYPI